MNELATTSQQYGWSSSARQYRRSTDRYSAEWSAAASCVGVEIEVDRFLARLKDFSLPPEGKKELIGFRVGVGSARRAGVSS